MSEPIAEFLKRSLVIPVVEVEDLEQAVPMAEALLEGGITTIEVTLRTQPALSVIEILAKTLPDMSVGAGTVLDGAQYRQAVDAGAAFVVSPGACDDLLNTAELGCVPLLPGAVTPSEIMRLRIRGYRYIKFFPAEASGGAKMLSSLAGPFKGITFCPTGGIMAHSLNAYLELDNVICVGGSWLTPKNAVRDHDWTTITELARAVGHSSQ